MEIASLRLFLRIAQRGTMSEAARDLGLSPASASARLAALENAVGSRLFHRTTRRVTLSEDGAVFLPYAQEALAAVDQGLAATGGRHVSPRGTLRIAAPASFGRMHIMPAIPDFMALYPGILPDLRLTDDVVDLVQGGFDVAIRNAELADSSLIARRLARDRRLLVASPGYLAARGEPADPDDLKDHACLVVGDHDRWSFAGPEGSHVVAISPVLRVSDGEAVRQAAEAGLGIALKSTWNAGDALRDGRLVPVLKAHPLAGDVALWALYPSGRLVAPKLRAFVDFFSERFGPSPPWDVGLAI